MTNFYTDESPGIKVSPVRTVIAPTAEQAKIKYRYKLYGLQVAVMILSLGFIAFVTLLHIVGKVHTTATVSVTLVADSSIIRLCCCPAH